MTPTLNVGVGTPTPTARVHVETTRDSGVHPLRLDVSGNTRFIVKNSGSVGIGTNAPAYKLDVAGIARVQELRIDGGADLAECFDIAGGAEEPAPGMVVSIDPAHPGRLTVSRKPYDRCVAGVISGAGGVDTGLLMGQRGSLADGESAVALNGRVYCLADARDVPIRPGDLLTTSGTPGHAMFAQDLTRAQGAILGKAMTPLDKGRGLVLVLVTLQ